MNTVQFVVLSVVLALARTETIPWPGPFADHINGQLVPDTPEVAAAKQHHAEAYARARAILPELPLEETNPTVHHHVLPQQPTFVPVQTVTHPSVLSFAPVEHKPSFTQFAEEIPRSPIGETPEVHAARQAHLKALEVLQATLPKLKEDESQASHFVPVQPIPVLALNNGPVDTPEVAAAKLEHARAYAAFARA